MENELSRAVDALPGLIWTAFPDGRAEFVNQRWCAFTGLSVEQAQGEGWQTAVHPDDLAALLEFWRPVVASGKPGESEARMRRFDGTYRWFLFRTSPVTDDAGHVVKWYGINADIDDSKRAETLLQGEKRLLEMVALQLPLNEVMDALCRLVEEVVVGCLCSVSLVDSGDMTFHNVCGLSESSRTIAPADGASARSSASGPCAMAADLKAQVLVPDVVSDSRWPSAWRERLLAKGLHSCWATPILSRDRKTEGVFTLYLPDSGNPTPFQCDLIGQFTHIASIAIERTRCHVAMKRSEEGFRAIVETTPECVKVVARDGTLLRINSAGSELAGAPCEAMLGKCFYDFVAPEHRQRVIEFNECVCSGKKGFLEFDIITLRGERRHMETHGAPMQARDGSIVHLGVTRDITARKQAEDQLRRSAALMAKAQQLSSSGSFCWHPATGEITWSEQAYRIFGLEPGTSISLDTVAARVHPGDVHLLHDVLERAQDGDDLESDHRLLLPDGSVKYVRMQAHATRDQEGRLEYIGAVQDVTDRRESEEALSRLRIELAHASRVNSLGALTASIAHEINQPLAGIMTNASTGQRMLSGEPPNVEGALETLRRTLRDGRRASEVLARLRALFSKKVVMTDVVDLGAAAHEVIELLRVDIRRKRIVLRLKIADGLPPVKGDKVQLQQVVLNLLLNAMDAMQGIDDRPRQIGIKIDRDDGDSDSVRLAVTDTGVGIEPQSAGKLFEAFYTTKKEGMGIGLSVCRSIIESHGGRLWACSNERVGATFSFSIPYHAERTGLADHHMVNGESARTHANVRSL